MRRTFSKPEHVVKQRIVPIDYITKLFPTNNTTKLFPFSNQILKQSISNLTNPNLASSKTPVVKIHQTSPKSSSFKTPVVKINQTSPKSSSSKTPVVSGSYSSGLGTPGVDACIRCAAGSYSSGTGLTLIDLECKVSFDTRAIISLARTQVYTLNAITRVNSIEFI